MKYQPTDVDGAYVVTLEPRGDERGTFARLFCAAEFGANGLDATVAQINNSISLKAGTLRGLHYQLAPKEEAKLIRCIRGAVFDVAVDLRPGSRTFGKWAGETLTPDNRHMMYIPRGCAHGFLSLEDNSEVIYLASSPYDGQRERIVRWNDPAFGIRWPLLPTVMSDKDRHAPDFDLARA